MRIYRQGQVKAESDHEREMVREMGFGYGPERGYEPNLSDVLLGKRVVKESLTAAPPNFCPEP